MGRSKGLVSFSVLFSLDPDLLGNELCELVEAVNDGVYLGAGEFYSSMRTGSRCIVRVEIYHHEPSDSDHVSYQVATLEFPENSEHRDAAGPWLHCYDGLGYKGLTCDKWPMLVIN